MRALEGLRQPWRALFVGGGPMADDLSAFAAAHPGRVRVLTGVGHDEVPEHLNAMDLLCAPSQTTGRWREQFGRMLIEAMACGVPVVASRSGEIPYVVGDAGLLVDESRRRPVDIGHRSTAGGSGAAARLVGRGLARAHEQFAWPVVARAHLRSSRNCCEAAQGSRLEAQARASIMWSKVLPRAESRELRAALP